MRRMRELSAEQKKLNQKVFFLALFVCECVSARCAFFSSAFDMSRMCVWVRRHRTQCTWMREPTYKTSAQSFFWTSVTMAATAATAIRTRTQWTHTLTHLIAVKERLSDGDRPEAKHELEEGIKWHHWFIYRMRQQMQKEIRSGRRKRKIKNKKFRPKIRKLWPMMTLSRRLFG